MALSARVLPWAIVATLLLVASIVLFQGARVNAQATPVINALNFPSIQAAIDSLQTSGGAVYIPAGTYQVPAKLRVYSNVTVFGAGMDQTVIQFIPGVVDHLMSNSSLTAGNSNLVVRDLSLIGRGDAASGCCFGLRLVNVRNSFVINVATDGHSLDGIYLGYNQQNGSINNRISGCRARGNGRNGIALTHGTGNTIDACLVDGNNLRELVAGIDLEPDEGLNVSNNRIVGNLASGQNVGIQLFAFDRALATVANNAVCTNVTSGNVNAGIYDFNGSANMYVSNQSTGNGNDFLVDPSALVGPQYASACQLGALPPAPVPPVTVTPTPALTSGPTPTATPTSGPIPTLTSSPCSPARPGVRVQATPAGLGRISVSVAVERTAGLPQNSLRTLRFGAATNALIDVDATIGSSGGTVVSFPAGTQQTTFTVRRTTAGVATTVPFVVVDDCGDWPTLVGGGPGAF